MKIKELKKIFFIQVFICTILYCVFFLLFKVNIHLGQDQYFIIKASFFILLFFIVSFIPILFFHEPSDDQLSIPKSENEKKLILERDTLEIENRLYKLMVNHLDDPLLVVSDDFKVYYYNNKLQGLFHLKENLTEVPIFEVTRNFIFQNFVQESISKGQKNSLEMFTFDSENHPSQRFFDLFFIPIKFSHKNLIVFRDVSEIKLTNQIREDFISNFSHEIRTPLTILNGQIQGLKSSIEDKNEIIHNTFLKIENNSRRLSNLFDDLLSLTQVEKKKNLNLEEFELEPIIDNVYQDLKLKHPNKIIDLELNLNQQTIKADYNLLEIVLINLIDNAIKYSKGNEVKIKIDTTKNNLCTILSVTDFGIGIPENSINRIFERFYRVDQSRSYEINGTGLGLSIVKHIIQKHSGKIKVNSQINQMTNFTISLPN